MAQKVGPEIPLTLMTNDAEEARVFWRRHEGEVIYKQFIAFPDAWRETRRLRPEDETQADAIAHAPEIFQKHVPAVADLRVTAVGGPSTLPPPMRGLPQDVRMNFDVKYQAHELPPETAEKLYELMGRLGLTYGAIDLRLTPEGRYVFLEVNPAGQFLYIEQATDQSIAAALAHVLLKKPEPRRPGLNVAREGRWSVRKASPPGKVEAVPAHREGHVIGPLALGREG